MFKLGEIKGADLLPPISLPEWMNKAVPAKAKSPARKSPARSRSQSPATKRAREHDLNLDDSELASEAQKMHLRTLMMEHPEVADNMKKLPSLPREMPLEDFEAKKLQFAAELSKTVPNDLVLWVLSIVAYFVNLVILQYWHVAADVQREYEADEALVKQMKTQLGLWLGDYLNSYTLMGFKLFVIHPWAAKKKGVTLTPAQMEAAAAASSSKSVRIDTQVQRQYDTMPPQAAAF